MSGRASRVAALVAAMVMSASVGRAQSAPRAGAADAAVVVALYADLDAPQASRAAVVARVLLDRYPGRVAVEFHHRPKDATVHTADAAVIAAAAQERGWEMAELLLANQDRRQPGDLAAMARMLGLDLDRFAAAMADRAGAAAAVRADVDEADRIRLAADTLLVINGEPAKTMTSDIERRYGALLGAPSDPSR